MIWDYDYPGTKVDEVSIYADSDWAGDAETRRSTTAVLEMIGPHAVDCCSVSQGAVALSSGEAELGAINRAAAGGLQTREILACFGLDLKLVIYSDSSAGRAMTQRRGAGKVRHLEVKDLWLQEKVRRQLLKVAAVRSEVNPADVGTKYLEASKIQGLLRLSGMRPARGWTQAAIACLLVSDADGSDIVEVDAYERSTPEKPGLGFGDIFFVMYFVLLHAAILVGAWALWRRRNNGGGAAPAERPAEWPVARQVVQREVDLSFVKTTVVALKEMCRQHGLRVCGNKQELLQRLRPLPAFARRRQLEILSGLYEDCKDAGVTLSLDDVMDQDRVDDLIRHWESYLID